MFHIPQCSARSNEPRSALNAVRTYSRGLVRAYSRGLVRAYSRGLVRAYSSGLVRAYSMGLVTATDSCTNTKHPIKHRDYIWCLNVSGILLYSHAFLYFSLPVCGSYSLLLCDRQILPKYPLYIIYISYRVTGLYRLGKTCYLHSLLCNNSIIAVCCAIIVLLQFAVQ